MVECEPKLSYNTSLTLQYVLKEILAEAYGEKLPSCSLSYVVSKVFERLVDTRLLDHLDKCDLISIMFLGLPDQLQIF